MLKHTVRVSELRMRADDPAELAERRSGGRRAEDAKPPYNTAGNLIWSLDGKDVEVSMLNGPMPRSLLRELLTFFVRHGVRRLIADRAGGHVLPLAHARSDGRYEMHVKELVDRFGGPGDTDWMPL